MMIGPGWNGDCSNVECPVRPVVGENCTFIKQDFECCGRWICGELPKYCTSSNGTLYEPYASWDEGTCLSCYCMYNIFSGAESSCYPRVYCPPIPHKDCISLGIQNGSCCEEYSCGKTTCQSNDKYYGIGEKWQLDSDPCQSCDCQKDGEFPKISCNSTVDQCSLAPAPGCRAITFSNECCAHDWDCTNEYLITTPKKWIRDQLANVCVFIPLGNGTVQIMLSIVLRDNTESKSETSLIETASRASYACVNLTVPHDMASTASLSIAGHVGSANVNKTLQVGITSVGQTFVQTDKYLYMPGQVVQFRILTVVGTSVLVSYENITQVWIVSPGGSRLIQWNNVENKKGLVQLQFPLANEVEEGEYKILVDAEGRQTSQSFRVEKYILPRFSLSVQPPPYVLRSDDEILFHICAEYTYGQPVMGTVVLSIKQTNPWYIWMDSISIDNDLIVIEKMFTGCTDISVNTTSIGSVWQPLTVSATFTEEGTGIEMTSSTSVQIQDYDIRFSDISIEKYYMLELPYLFQVNALRPDDTAAEGKLLSVCVANTCKNVTVGESGIVSVFIPPHLMSVPNTDIQVQPILDTIKQGPMGSIDSSPYNFSVTAYYSPTSSGLSLDVYYDSISCHQEANTVSIPVYFIANGTDKEEVWIQVVSRSQLIYTSSKEVIFTSSNLPINKSLLLEPLQPVALDLVRGSFNIDIPLTPLISPVLKVLIWYSRTDGEVVSAAVSVDVGQCLNNPTSLSWQSKLRPAPKDAATITISSSPNSVCGLGVVDRSVEMLSRSQPGKLTIAEIFNTLSSAEVNSWEFSQINNDYYCYGNEGIMMGAPNLPIKKKRSKLQFVSSSGSDYGDAISAFDESGLLVLSDLTLETRPCHPPVSYSWGYGGIVGGAGGAGLVEGAPGPLSEDKGTTTLGSKEQRTYFPETWLWKLLIISESGQINEDVQLPDTITEWVGEAVCAHPKFGVGISAPSSITVFTPFFLDLALPPTARQGESVPVLVSVFNYFDQNLPVTVTLQNSSEFTSNSQNEDVCVTANEKSVVKFIVTSSQVGMVNLTFIANINTENEDCGGAINITKSDIVVKPLRVLFEGVMKETTYSDYVCSNNSAVSWYLETPKGIVNNSEKVFVSVSADLLGPTLENLGNLIQMPYGCGEQNMLNFAPNIFILQYLEASYQDTPEIKQKVIDYMISGYQRELTYRHSDGSYSAFGNSDGEGSTWLTAFVLKSFSHAAEYITVDENDLQVSKSWLLSLQEESGCFTSVGRVIHSDMKGGLENSEDPQIPLTTFVLISLLETNQNDTTSINNAVGCIASSSSNSSYVNALKAYALALSANNGAGDLIDSVYNALTMGTSGLSEAVLVEAAGYLLLAMMTSDPAGYVGQSVNIAKLISNHRNGQGGFVSTQDTVVALQALAAFSKVYPPTNTNLDLDVNADGTILKFSITAENRLVLQKQDITSSPPYNVNVSSSGVGCAVVMVVQRYNIPVEAKSSAFDLSVEVTVKNCSSTATVEICASYLLKQIESNMAVMNIEPETGFTVVTSDLEDLKSRDIIKRFEEDEGMVNLYFDSVAANKTCVTFDVQRNFAVENAKPGTVTIYDYYQPSSRITKELSISAACLA